MDLQNNNATRVAGLDERGVSIERDGKQVKFIPWGEDAEARAAAAAAASAADAAGRKATQAANKADSAASAAGEATATAQEAQEAAEQAAAAASNAVQKISSEPQTAGKTLTSQSDDVPSGIGWQLTADGSSASTGEAEISATGAAGKASNNAGAESVTSVVQNKRGTTRVESGIRNAGGGTVAYHHIDTDAGRQIEARLKGQNADGKLWGGEDAIGQQILAVQNVSTSSLEVGAANLYGKSVTSESDYAHFFSAKLLASAPATEPYSKASLILTAVSGKKAGETYKWWRTVEIDGFNQKITVSRRTEDGSFEVREIDLWALGTPVS